VNNAMGFTSTAMNNEYVMPLFIFMKPGLPAPGDIINNYLLGSFNH
jgi:hypothetical protein